MYRGYKSVSTGTSAVPLLLSAAHRAFASAIRFKFAMIWIAPSEKNTATDTLEKRLWSAAVAMTPEEKARQKIDALLGASGWVVQTKDKINLSVNLQRASRLRQSILQKAFTGQL